MIALRQHGPTVCFLWLTLLEWDDFLGKIQKTKIVQDSNRPSIKKFFLLISSPFLAKFLSGFRMTDKMYILKISLQLSGKIIYM